MLNGKIKTYWYHNISLLWLSCRYNWLAGILVSCILVVFESCPLSGTTWWPWSDNLLTLHISSTCHIWLVRCLTPGAKICWLSRSYSCRTSGSHLSQSLWVWSGTAATHRANLLWLPSWSCHLVNRLTNVCSLALRHRWNIETWLSTWLEWITTRLLDILKEIGFNNSIIIIIKKTF